MKGAFWLGLVVLIPSGFLLRWALRPDAAELEGPKWLGITFALLFVSGGLLILLMDSAFDRWRQNAWFSYFHVMSFLLIPTYFALMLNWVAFGPGEREFSMDISIPFFALYAERVNELFGRFTFAIPALLLDGLIGLGIFSWIRSLMGVNEK